jgi:tetratricopeptide (TPR) repeat protein
VSDVVPERGTLDAIPLPLLLLQIYRQRSTGTLVLRRETVEKRVALRDGVPVMAESNLPSESLGIQLLDAGRITREDYARLVEAVKKRRCKEGVALLGLELVAPRELFESLKQQVRRRLLDCLGWPHGDFTFEAGEPVTDEATAFRCDPLPLVQEGVAIHWNRARLREALAERWNAYMVATPRTAALAQRVHRDAEVDRVVAGIGGTQPLGALLDAAPGPTAIAAVFVLDAIGGVAFQPTPPLAKPEVEEEDDDGDAFVIEVVRADASTATSRSDAEASRDASRTAKSNASAAHAAKLREELESLEASLRESDHYSLLGVARDANAGAIRRAYVQAAKRFHPDAVVRLGLHELRERAQSVFARIAEAHEVLSDATRRSDYDRSLEAGGEDFDASRLVQAEALYRKAEILLRAGNFAGAIEFLRPAVALWPEESAYQSALGWALYKKLPSEPKPAREHLEHAVALDDRDAVAVFRLGMVLRALGETEAADLALERAKRLDPKIKS